MAEVLRRTWTSDHAGLGASRRDRRSCVYEAYVPDPLVGRLVVLEGGVAADVADAEAAIIRLNTEARALVDTEAIARILLRAEAVASSRIEGLEIGARRLLRAEASRRLDEQPADVTATQVLGNIEAMVYAVESVSTGDDITLDLLLEVHRRLLEGTALAKHGGQVRTQQNWIGGSSFNPCSAVFVPPPHELVEELLADLCAFCCTDELPAVAQAAIAHAQFETLHPFIDGNGRTGRALIHLVLRRRGLAPRVLPPVSLILATWARSYIDGLTSFRHVGAASDAAAVTGLNQWVGTFSAAVTRAVDDAVAYEDRARELEHQWRERVGRIRAGSATQLLLAALPGAPVLTVDSAAQLIGRTYKPANDAIERLVGAGILRQLTIGRRNRAFEAPDVIAAFTALERQLASPEGDARVSEPSRRVPVRRRPAAQP
jgi:Fic family protein